MQGRRVSLSNLDRLIYINMGGHVLFCENRIDPFSHLSAELPLHFGNVFFKLPLVSDQPSLPDGPGALCEHYCHFALA